MASLDWPAPEWAATYSAAWYSCCSFVDLREDIQLIVTWAALSQSAKVLTTYTGDQIPLVGEKKVEVSYGTQRDKLNMYVVKGDGPNFFGREWLRAVQLDW